MNQIHAAPIPLSPFEKKQLNRVVFEALDMAAEQAPKRPKMTTLVEEFAEAVLASRGKHDDPLRLELMQIMSLVANLVWQLDLYGEEEISNLRTFKEDQK